MESMLRTSEVNPQTKDVGTKSLRIIFGKRVREKKKSQILKERSSFDSHLDVGCRNWW